MQHWKIIFLLFGVLAATGCVGSFSPSKSQAPSSRQVSTGLSINATSVDFGNTAVGVTTTRELTIANAGTQQEVIAQRQVTGASFSTAGIGSNLTLAPGQSATLSVSFRPTEAGNSVGSVILDSNGGQSPVVITLAGQGVASAHSVTLSWGAAPSSAIGYYAYRKTSAEAPWMRLGSSLNMALFYTDFAVQAGQLYFYAVSAIGPDNTEGPLSDPITVEIPSP